jgi:glucan 1,3-beta-glucosidase
MDNIGHNGIAPEQNDPNYKVFRNVQDFGAKGDGIHDDTAAINAAITSVDAGFDARCAPGLCNSTTITPALVISSWNVLLVITNNCLGLLPQWYLPCI